MSDLLELVTLQTIDDGLDQSRARLAAVEEQLAGNSEVVELGERLDAARANLAGLQRDQRASDAALADLGARIHREEKKLYDGSIKQFKELQSLEADLGHLKDERAALEDRGLALLSDVEAAAAEEAAIERDLARASAAWEEQSATLEAEAADLRSAVAGEQALRDRQVGEITAGAVRLYEGLRKRKGGKAVVRVQGSSCLGCRMTIPDAVRRRIVNSPTLVQCPHCERILAPG